MLYVLSCPDVFRVLQSCGLLPATYTVLYHTSSHCKLCTEDGVRCAFREVRSIMLMR